MKLSLENLAIKIYEEPLTIDKLDKLRLYIAKVIAEHKADFATNDCSGYDELETLYLRGAKGLENMSFSKLKEELYFEDAVDHIINEYFDEECIKQLYREVEYKARCANACPNCWSTEIVPYKNLTIEGGGASQQIHCDECGATWDDVYSLNGFDNLEVPVEESTDKSSLG